MKEEITWHSWFSGSDPYNTCHLCSSLHNLTSRDIICHAYDHQPTDLELPICVVPFSDFEDKKLRAIFHDAIEDPILPSQRSQCLWNWRLMIWYPLSVSLDGVPGGPVHPGASCRAARKIRFQRLLLIRLNLVMDRVRLLGSANGMADTEIKSRSPSLTVPPMALPL